MKKVKLGWRWKDAQRAKLHMSPIEAAHAVDIRRMNEFTLKDRTPSKEELASLNFEWTWDGIDPSTLWTSDTSVINSKLASTKGLELSLDHGSDLTCYSYEGASVGSEVATADVVLPHVYQDGQHYWRFTKEQVPLYFGIANLWHGFSDRQSKAGTEFSRYDARAKAWGAGHGSCVCVRAHA